MRKDGKQTDMYDYDFPKRLRSLLEGKTQQEVATAIGKSRQTVSYYANGEAAPDYETIIRLADYFQVTTDYLLGVSDIRTPKADLQAVCKYTGLSESAVENLHTEACGRMGNEPISALIGKSFENYHVLNYLVGIAISSFFLSSGEPRMVKPGDPILKHRGLSGMILRKEMAAFDMYQLQRELEELIQKISKDFKIPDWILHYYGLDDTAAGGADNGEHQTD